MEHLKFKYRFLTIFLSVAIVFPPLGYAATNKRAALSFVENSYVIQQAIERYNIDYDECVSCQENGWPFSSILISYMLSLMVGSFLMMYAIISISLRVSIGWSSSHTFNILLRGRYPKAWLK